MHRDFDGFCQALRVTNRLILVNVGPYSGVQFGLRSTATASHTEEPNRPTFSATRMAAVPLPESEIGEERVAGAFRDNA